MSKCLVKGQIALFIILGFLSTSSYSQIIYTEDFNYSPGNFSGAGGSWFNDCFDIDLQISSGGLTYSGYLGSGIGNAVQVFDNGSNSGSAYTVNNFGGVSTPAYMGFLLSVAAAPASVPVGAGCSNGTPGIIAFDTGGGGSGNDDAVFVMQNGVGYNIGLMTSCCSNSLSSTILTYGVVYLIVIKLDGSQLSLYINPSLGQPEPGSPAVQVGTSGGSFINGIAIGSRAQANAFIDGIRLSSNWNAIVSTAPTTQVTNLSLSNVQENSVRLDFSPGNGNGRIVVVKQGSPVDAIPVSGTVYSANSNYGFGSEIGTGNYVVIDDCCNFNPYNIFNLASGTTYHFRAFEYNNSSGTYLYNTNTATGNPASVGTLFSEPSQAFNITFSSVSPTSLTVNWVNGSGTGRLVYGRAGGLNGNVPADGTTYTANPAFGSGSNLGSGTFVVYGSGGSSVPVTGLTPGNFYEFGISDYNGSGTQINYNTSFVNNGTFTLSLEPTSHAGLFSAINSGSTNQINLNFAAASTIVNANGYIILRRVGANPDGTGVTDGLAPGSLPLTAGTSLVTVITNTALVNFNDNGLTPGTNYNYALIPFGFNGSNNQTYNYRTAAIIPTTAASTLATEPTAQPTAINFTNPSNTGFTVGYTAAAGSPAGYLAIRRQGASPTGAPADGTTYSVGNTIGDGTVAFVGSALSFAESGLLASTVYHYDIFSYNGSGTQINYRTTSPLEGNRTTLAVEPTAQPTALNFSGETTTSLNASFTAAAGAPAGYIVLQRVGASPTGIPVDGTSYSVGNAIGDGAVVALVTSPTSFSQSSLTPGTEYFYDIFSFNGSGLAINYRTASPLQNSRFTLPAAPTANSGSSVTTTSFNASWNSVTGSASYRLDVSSDNFSTFVTGFQNLTVAGTSQSVVGLSLGITYSYRVRAVNVTGTSANSNVISVTTIPAEPVASAASGVSSSGFDANWSSVVGATSYLLEVSVDNFASTIAGYSPKELTGTSESITALSPGTSYSYRVRAKNASGQSGLSNVINQVTIPSIPVLKTFNQSLANAGGFVAEWTEVPGADGYELDVSTQASNFATLVAGYEGKVINGGGTIDEVVSGLVSGQFYRYRIRAFNAGGVSGNSESKLAVTTGGSYVPPSVTTGTSSTSAVAAAVTGGGGTVKLTLYHRKISETEFTMEPEQTVSSGTTTVPISASFFDEIGMEYYFKVIDELENSSTTSPAFVYQTKSSESIPNLSSGGKRENYRIFSIPMQLSDNTIDNIFNPVIIQYGGYKKDQWRLVQYLNGKNVDYTEGLTRIDQGKGYWFNSFDPVSLNISGSVIQANQSQPFVLSLSAGWNQIGNPYNFPISWSDILASNGNPSTVGNLFTYNSSAISFDQDDLLNAWEGGFVRVDQSINLEIPVTVKRTAGRAKSLNIIEGSDLKADMWFVPISISQGIALNSLGGFGMHPEAALEKDQYDEHPLPRFVNYLEWNSYHQDYFIPKFSRDVVPSADRYTWRFEVESNFEGEEIQITWRNDSFGENDAQLWLVDINGNFIVNMRETAAYRFASSETRSFEVIYATSPELLTPRQSVLGAAFPNPFSDTIMIPVIADGSHATELAVFDMMGRKVAILQKGVPSVGYQQYEWTGKLDSGEPASAGLYFYRLSTVGGKVQIGRMIKK